jgi:hypothetical protein
MAAGDIVASCFETRGVAALLSMRVTTVIASEAKQSSFLLLQQESWIASSLRSSQ